MNEPTLTELREMAVGCRGILASRGHSDALTVLDAFLALTDPTPLTAEHCREAGGTLMGDILVVPGVGWLTGEMKRPMRLDPSFSTINPTRGQLKLALMMENSDE